MHKVNRSIAVAVLSLALGGAALAQDTQRAVLSGTTADLRWSAYGPGVLPNLDTDEGTLRLSVPPGADVTGAKYQETDETLILAFQADAPLRAVYQFHDQQFIEQGFERTAQTIDANEARAVYRRGNDVIELRLNAVQGGAYRALFNLTGVQAASQAGAQANQAPAPRLAEGELLRDELVDGVAVVVYAPGRLTTLSEDPSSINLSAPEGTRDLNVARQDEDIAVTFAAPDLTLLALRDYYLGLLRQQGYEVQDGLAEIDAEADQAAATFARGANIIEWSAERTDDEAYRVLFNFQGALDDEAVNAVNATQVEPTEAVEADVAAAGVGEPLYGYEREGVRYNFYGPDYYAAGNTIDNLQANEREFRLIVPQGARDVNVPTQEAEVISTLFESPQQLREVFSFYDLQFRQQGFEQVAGSLTEDQTKVNALYQRGDDRVLFSVENQGGSSDEFFNYEARLNLDPAE